MNPQNNNNPRKGKTAGTKVAVVILNWNGLNMLRQYLPSVTSLSHEAEVYVADNASTDDSMTFLAEQYPQVHTMVLDRNYGFAEGYNRALQQIDAQYYVLLNSDVEVAQHWLAPLIAWMDAHDDTAACQPKILSVAERDRFEYAGAAGGFMDRLGYPFCRGRVFSTVERDEGQYDSTADVMWATGACMMVRAKDFHEAGGFDARFFAHCEEIDLCWRMRLAGRRIVCVPESRVYHVGGGTLPKKNPMKTFLNFRNNLTMLYKNLPEEQLKPVMRRRWWLDRLAMLQMVLSGSLSEARAVMRGRREYRRWKHEFDDERKRIQSMAQAAAAESALSDCAILWQYYARGRKTFTRLPL